LARGTEELRSFFSKAMQSGSSEEQLVIQREVDQAQLRELSRQRLKLPCDTEGERWRESEMPVIRKLR
jgi:hypothetical protein